MVNKTEKFFDVGVFFIAILEVDPAQNLAKYKRWLYVLSTNESIVIT